MRRHRLPAGFGAAAFAWSFMACNGCGSGPSVLPRPDLIADAGAWDVPAFVQDVPDERYTFSDPGSETWPEDTYFDHEPYSDVHQGDAWTDPGTDDTGNPDSIDQDPGPTDTQGPDPGGTDAGTNDPGWDLADPWPGDVQYTGIYAGLGELEGQDLVDALCQLVHSGYHGIGYSDAKDEIVDIVDDYDGKVLAVYKGDWVWGGNGLNVEHTWPQSKGAGSVPAKSDIFHLFPTHPNFNSARGNLTFGIVVYQDWPDSYDGDPDCTDHFPGHPEGCFSVRGDDEYGVEVFEPRDGQKGNTARAIFYFSIRYGNDCKVKSLEVLDPAHPGVTEEVLKLWNAMDPPDDIERERNDRVESIQNVRNPFIDHPEFVDRISFQ